MGRMSREKSALSIIRAVRLPLAKYLETSTGTFLEASKLTRSLREEHMCLRELLLHLKDVGCEDQRVHMLLFLEKTAE